MVGGTGKGSGLGKVYLSEKVFWQGWCVFSLASPPGICQGLSTVMLVTENRRHHSEKPTTTCENIPRNDLRTKDKDQHRQELRNSFQRQTPTSSKVLCLA